MSGGLRNWTLIKLDKDRKDRFGNSLPRNQVSSVSNHLPHFEDTTNNPQKSPLESYNFRYSLLYSLLSFNGAHLTGGTNSFRSIINSTKTESHFLTPLLSYYQHLSLIMTVPVH